MNKKKIVNELIEWLKAFLVALVAALIIMQFVLIAQISGRSMNPTLEDGQHVITARHFTSIDQGDIIAFDFIMNDGTEEFHVKRVVGMPGDTVELDGTKVYVNDEVAIDDGIIDFGQKTYELSDTQYFVVGDNYGNSYDSRDHGPIEEDSILGEVVINLPF